MKKILVTALASLLWCAPALAQSSVFLQNQVLAGPTSGAGFPAPRALVGADLPIGTSVQAWGALLDCFNALATTGIVRRTGAGACSAGTAVALASEVSGNLPVTNLNSGTGANSQSFWNGSGAWQPVGTPAVSGRLTLASGVPVMTPGSCSNAQCSAQQTLYFAPDGGSYIPVYDGTSQKFAQFTSSPTDAVGLTLSLAGSANWAANSCFDVFYANVSGTMYFGTGPAWTACAGSPVTATASSWSIAGTTLTVTTLATGSFAAGGKLYGTAINGGTYIVAQLSGTAGGAGTYALTQPSTASAGTLTQQGPASRGYSLAKYNGVPVNAATITVRYGASLTISVPANQATYLGTVATDAGTAGQITFQFGTAAAGGGQAIHNVWNYWDRKLVTTDVNGNNNATFTSAIAAGYKTCFDSATYRITFLSGLPDDSPYFSMNLYGGSTNNTGANGATSGGGFIIDIGSDPLIPTPFLDAYSDSTNYSTNSTQSPHTYPSNFVYQPQIGQHFVQCYAGNDGATITSQYQTGGGVGDLIMQFRM